MDNEQNTAQNNNQEASQNQNTETSPTDSSKSFGPAIGILIIVMLLAFGGLYFFGASLQGGDAPMIPTDPSQISFEVYDTTTEEYIMTDEEFEALIGDGSAAPNTEEILFDDLSDLDSLDAELDALELEL